jgi:hypothetical protein
MEESRVRRSALVLAAAAALLTGCDGGGESSAPTATKMRVANPHQDQLMALTELNRSLALRRAIQDTGQSCKKITSSAYSGEYKGLHMWVGRCTPGRDWAIFIAANGDVQVRDCAEAKTLGLPECKLEPAEAAKS